MTNENENKDKDQVEKETLEDLEANEAEDVKGGTLIPTHAGCTHEVKTFKPDLTT